MSLTQNKKLFQGLIGFGAIVVVVIFGSILFSLSNNPKESEQLAPNKIVPPQKNIQLSNSIDELKNKLIASPISNNNGDLLLYTTENFYIEYITTPKVFFVKISKDPDKSKIDAQKWFISKGFSQEDLCPISVRFVLTTMESRKENPNFSSLPDGCTGEPIKKS